MFLTSVTTSAKSWNDFSTFEQMQRRLTRTGISDGHVRCSHVFLLLSGFFSLWIVVFPNKRWTDFLHPRLPYRVSTDNFEHNMWNPLLELLFLEQANGSVASYLVEIDVAKIALSCHFALDLLCYKEEVLASA